MKPHLSSQPLVFRVLTGSGLRERSSQVLLSSASATGKPLVTARDARCPRPCSTLAELASAPRSLASCILKRSTCDKTGADRQVTACLPGQEANLLLSQSRGVSSQKSICNVGDWRMLTSLLGHWGSLFGRPPYLEAGKSLLAVKHGPRSQRPDGA